jgi:hypothetical protein
VTLRIVFTTNVVWSFLSTKLTNEFLVILKREPHFQHVGTQPSREREDKENNTKLSHAENTRHEKNKTQTNTTTSNSAYGRSLRDAGLSTPSLHLEAGACASPFALLRLGPTNVIIWIWLSSAA